MYRAEYFMCLGLTRLQRLWATGRPSGWFLSQGGSRALSSRLCWEVCPEGTSGEKSPATPVQTHGTACWTSTRRAPLPSAGWPWQRPQSSSRNLLSPSSATIWVYDPAQTQSRARQKTSWGICFACHDWRCPCCHLFHVTSVISHSWNVLRTYDKVDT